MREKKIAKKQRKDVKKVKMLETHVRFDRNEWDVYMDVAKQHKKHASELVRILCAGNMSKYLKHIIFVDEDNTAKMKEEIAKLCTEMERTRHEIVKYGTNVNQIAKAINQGQVPDNIEIPDVNEALGNFDASCAEVGDILWHMLV